MSCWSNIHLCVCFSDRPKNGVSSHFNYLPYEGWRGGRETGRKDWEKGERGERKERKGGRKEKKEIKGEYEKTKAKMIYNDRKVMKHYHLIEKWTKLVFYFLFIVRFIFPVRERRRLSPAPLLYIYNRWTNWQRYRKRSAHRTPSTFINSLNSTII